MPISTQSIPLNDLMNDLRVKDCLVRKQIEIRKEYMNYYKNYHSQISSCHSWLICLHYEAINRLQEKYKISKPEFMVLMGSYLFKCKGKNGFPARELSSTLLSWQYNRVYRHLNKLSAKGYIRMEKNIFSGLQRYYISFDGERIIRAFSQHYWQVFHEVRGKLGDLPDSFTSFL
jgi:DNA-binding MarR family transcriptional regulator